MKIENYYLDLEKVLSLPEEDKRMIQNMYMNMIEMNPTTSRISIFNTLLHCGYLKEIRNEKIEKILS